MSATCHETAKERASLPLPILIRRFQQGDEASFNRLNEEWIVQHFELEEKDRVVLNDPVKYILNPGGQILFAVSGEVTIGCCALIREEPGVYEVAKMGVTKVWQGRGVGRKLLDAVIAEAMDMGASRLYLETNGKLANAIHLYASLGFRHLPPERVKTSLYERADVFMERLLR